MVKSRLFSFITRSQENKQAKNDIRAMLTQGLSQHWAQMNRELIDRIVLQCLPLYSAVGETEEDRYKYLVNQLREFIRQQVDYLEQIKNFYEEFIRQYSQVVSLEDQYALIERFDSGLGYGRRKTASDKRALNRYLDQQAMVDRYEKGKAVTARNLSFVFERWGFLIEKWLQLKDSDAEQCWVSLSLMEVFQSILQRPNEPRLKAAVLRCFAHSVSALDHTALVRHVPDSFIRGIFRFALDAKQDEEIQIAAFELLPLLSISFFEQAVLIRLDTKHQEGDSIFVRYAIVRACEPYFATHDVLKNHIAVMIKDSSPYVRQAVAQSIRHLPFDQIKSYLYQLTQQDPDAEVRAAAIIAFQRLAFHAETRLLYLSLLIERLTNEPTDKVIGAVLQQISDCARALWLDEEASKQWSVKSLVALESFIEYGENIPLRRTAYEVIETCWVYETTERRQMLKALRAAVRDSSWSSSVALPKNLLDQHDKEDVWRVLSYLAIQDFGFDVRESVLGIEVIKGPVFRIRLWRILHELRNSETDKRQGFSHTVGRAFYGNVRIPARRLSEMSQTKVPGEAVYQSEDGSWRPFLPLVDDFIGALDLGWWRRKVTIITPEGKTEIHAPRSPLKRLLARLMINLFYARYARLRNWSAHQSRPKNEFINTMRSLGFEVNFIPHVTTAGVGIIDSSVQPFFTALPIPFLGEWYERARLYFFSVYENTVNELIVFIALVTAYFVAQQVFISWRIRYWRSQIPMVIGGWGTRGKSGTERLKAALMNGLGFSTLCKTTGCEATFLYAHPYGKLHEMYLFRPYDKATIWEQRNVLKLAYKLKTDVFLWECMALRPNYVSIMQRQWMRDDIATITNTYPDHEDVQGPSGWNVARVMTRFIPDKALLITTETEMLPLLKQGAEKQSTQCISVEPIQAELLTTDVLAAFPYQEHPSNIALCLELATHLGISQNFALREMAKRVVPDIGVLRVYPWAAIHGRHLQFVNGMSANERLGCLANWKRLKFDDPDYDFIDGRHKIVVVNNRADRVARSKVFASVLVNDIDVDVAVLVGSNISGFLHFFWQAWEDSIGRASFLTDSSSIENKTQYWINLAHRLRIPTSVSALRNRINHLLSAVNAEDIPIANDIATLKNDFLKLDFERFSIGEEEVTQIRQWVERMCLNTEFFIRYADKIKSGLSSSEIEQIKRQLRSWWEAKLVVVSDVTVSGTELVDVVAKSIPHGATGRIMAIQNIKGPGLTFAYEWQRWAHIYETGQRARTGTEQTIVDSIHRLATESAYSEIARDYLTQLLQYLRGHRAAQSELVQAEINVIEQRLISSSQTVTLQASGGNTENSIIRQFLAVVESFFDVGDSVKRLREANSVYAALIAEQISLEGAADKLKEITSRQHGGWLTKKDRETVD